MVQNGEEGTWKGVRIGQLVPSCVFLERSRMSLVRF